MGGVVLSSSSMTSWTTFSDVLLMDGYEAQVTYKVMKRLRVRIKPPDGTVAVSAPLDTPEHVIDGFLRTHHAWILQTRSAVRLRSPRPESLVTGGRVRLWGTWRELVVQDAARARAREINGHIHIQRPFEDGDAARRAMEALYRREMGIALERLLALWEPQVGRRAAGTKLRRMTSRWGSCNTVTAVITFNTMLAKFAPEALEFVVVHELVHLLERGHGPVFKGHMGRLLPDWPSRRQLLREAP